MSRVPTKLVIAAMLVANNEAKQAKIDALMFEYCPNEITKEQVSNYELNAPVLKTDNPKKS